MICVGYKTPRLSDGSGGNHIFAFTSEMPSLPRYGSVNNSERERDVTRQMSGMSNSGLPGPPDEDVSDTMRRRLRFFFMNPLEKWNAKRQFPYKLTIQLIKIFFVTLQVWKISFYWYLNLHAAKNHFLHWIGSIKVENLLICYTIVIVLQISVIKIDGYVNFCIKISSNDWTHPTNDFSYFHL